MNVKREIKLVNKVKRLVRRLGFPRFLNKYGPKKYELYLYLCIFLIRHFCRLSYRRTVNFLCLLDFKCPSKSSLHYNNKNIPIRLWINALKLTSGSLHHIIAVDSTGLTRVNPSYYYLRRIDGKIPKKYTKVSIAYDTRNKKYCSSKIRLIPRHDVNDFNYLINNIKCKIIVADKGYDSEKIHKYCYTNNIEAHIPIRKYGKGRHKNLGYRIRASKLFRLRTYGRRNIVESGMHSLKSKYGYTVNSKKAKTIKADIYGRMLCHNLLGTFNMT